MRRYFLPLLLLAACTAPSGEQTANSDASTTGKTAAPQLQFFSSSDSSVAAVVEGAGCAYTLPGLMGDSSLFELSSDGVIRVNNKIEVLKMIGSDLDSNGDSHWENALYRLDLHTVDDSLMEGGVTQHGDIILTEKANGIQSTVKVTGGCGC